MDLSHWRDGQVPASLYGDTGFDLAWQARQQGLIQRLVGAPLVNDHIDADGLLAAAAVQWPIEVLTPKVVHLLARAAACGDFTEWHGMDALAIVLTLHEWIAEAQPHGAGWEQSVYDRMAVDWEACLGAVRQPSTDVAAMLRHVAQRQNALPQEVHTQAGPGWATAIWQNDLGHRTDVYGGVHWQDDVPLWLLDAVLPRAAFQYTAWQGANGWQHLIEAPRYSWARTMMRPSVWHEPDWSVLCNRLNDLENGAASWSQEDAKRAAFTGRLGSLRRRINMAQALPRSRLWQLSG